MMLISQEKENVELEKSVCCSPQPSTSVAGSDSIMHEKTIVSLQVCNIMKEAIQHEQSICAVPTSGGSATGWSYAYVLPFKIFFL